MNILLLSRYTRLGASSRVRSYQYIPFLEKHHMAFDIAPLFNETYLKDLYQRNKKSVLSILRSYISRIGKLIQSGKYDLLWIEYELFPWLPSFAEKLLSVWGIPYIVDYDDAVFHRYDINHNPVIRGLLGKKIDHVMQGSAMVLAGNTYLLKRAQQAGAKRIAFLPTVIDLERYVVRKKNTSNQFTIGWIGSPTTAAYFLELLPALTMLCEDKNTFLNLVGAGKNIICGERIRTLPWSEATEVAEIQKFDVGIMPLPDTLWAKGKCGYKLIQYMACGCPVVASPVGVNQEIVTHGKNGFLSANLPEWTENLTRLRDDAELRVQLGNHGRRTVEQKYCLQVTAPKLVKLIQSLV